MKYFVSRQVEWISGDHIVEVVCGGVDYANPDMLVPYFKGEGCEYNDPREAVDAAINIRNAWKQTKPEVEIEIAFGATGGFTLPLTRYDDDELIKKAEELYAKLPKCEYCGEVLSDERYGHDFSDEYVFCSRNCAEQDYLAQIELNNEAEAIK